MSYTWVDADGIYTWAWGGRMTAMEVATPAGRVLERLRDGMSVNETADDLKVARPFAWAVFHHELAGGPEPAVCPRCCGLAGATPCPGCRGTGIKP